jgi:hypothetical protein
MCWKQCVSDLYLLVSISRSSFRDGFFHCIRRVPLHSHPLVPKSCSSELIVPIAYVFCVTETLCGDRREQRHSRGYQRRKNNRIHTHGDMCLMIEGEIQNL